MNRIHAMSFVAFVSCLLTAHAEDVAIPGRWRPETTDWSQATNLVIGDWGIDRPRYSRGFYPHGVTILVGLARRGEHRVGSQLMPRFVWANRGVTEMTVWMARYAE